MLSRTSVGPLTAARGFDQGREATAEALAWAWEHWVQVRGMDNPTGYLFRVGQSRTRTRKTPTLVVRATWSDPLVEPRLAQALTDLSEQQRTAVVLVHAYGWTLREVAELHGITVSTVQTHLERGLFKLRMALEVEERA